MKIYRQFCANLGLPAQIYLIAIVIGFLGATACIYFQVVEQYRDFAVLCLPFIGAPIGVVLFNAQGDYCERMLKIFSGTLVTFFGALVPGYFFGVLLAENFG